MITAAGIMLTLSEGHTAGLRLSIGALMVLGVCTCWGAENNCTRNLSIKDPSQVVVIKGTGSGIVSLCLAVAAGEKMPGAAQVLGALLLSASFIGEGISFVVFRQLPTLLFLLALALMGAGAAVALGESHSHRHRHAPVEHDHRHSHDDGHHTHAHAGLDPGMTAAEHSHWHVHEETEHEHEHTPDIHHRHAHSREKNT